MAATLSIVRVLSITDTREYVEEGDRWVPVPGSGVEHECARCGRTHEVLAVVELSDGSESCVGTGCARQESAEIVRALANGARAAKRTRILERELATERARVAAWDALAAAFDAAPFPAITERIRPASESDARHGRRGTLIVEAGGVEVWCGEVESLAAMRSDDREERLACLRSSLRDRACGGSRRSHYLAAAEEALARHERRIAARA